MPLSTPHPSAGGKTNGGTCSGCALSPAPATEKKASQCPDGGSVLKSKNHARPAACSGNGLRRSLLKGSTILFSFKIFLYQSSTKKAGHEEPFRQTSALLPPPAMFRQMTGSRTFPALQSDAAFRTHPAAAPRMPPASCLSRDDKTDRIPAHRKTVPQFAFRE